MRHRACGLHPSNRNPTSLTIRHVQMTACLAWAFDIQESQLVAPDWSNDVMLDIFAKTLAPVAETPPALQAPTPR